MEMNSTFDRSTAKVSIVVATHNGARFLEAQLDSLARQTFVPFEIIISDDASSDDTHRICTEFAKRSAIAVRWIRNVPARGFADNFMLAAERAKGDLIAFCDQDDIWEPDKLARCADFFGMPGITLIVHRATLIDDGGRPIGMLDQRIRQTRIVPPLSYDPWGTFAGFSMVFRRDILIVTAGLPRFRDYIDPRRLLAHDRWITLLAQLLGSVAEVAEPLVRYRQHAANVYGVRGQAPAPSSRASRIAESRLYCAATADMIRLVDGIDPAAERLFPGFNRARARTFVARAYAQQQARAEIFESSRLGALMRIGLNLARGRYHSVHQRRLRMRSIAKDVRIALTGV